MNGNRWILIGSVLAFLGVALGAFGAHALSASLSAEALAWWQTATQYQLLHSLALVAWGIRQENPATAVHGAFEARAGLLFTIGILLFSGSLYLLALSGYRAFGALTPFGGIAFLAGWIAFGLSTFNPSQRRT